MAIIRSSTAEGQKRPNTRAHFENSPRGKFRYSHQLTRRNRAPDFLSRCFRRCAPGIAPGEQAAAEEGAFQRAIAVHAATAEAGRFAGGVKPRHDLAAAAEYAGVEGGPAPAH